MKGKKTEKKQKGKKTCIILIAPQALDVSTAEKEQDSTSRSFLDMRQQI
jgi:hypothetical protein